MTSHPLLFSHPHMHTHTAVSFASVLEDVRLFLEQQTARGVRDILLCKFQAEGGMRKNKTRQRELGV
jgi:hypothetical protein